MLQVACGSGVSAGEHLRGGENILVFSSAQTRRPTFNQFRGTLHRVAKWQFDPRGEQVCSGSECCTVTGAGNASEPHVGIKSRESNFLCLVSARFFFLLPTRDEVCTKLMKSGCDLDRNFSHLLPSLLLYYV